MSVEALSTLFRVSASSASPLSKRASRDLDVGGAVPPHTEVGITRDSNIRTKDVCAELRRHRKQVDGLDDGCRERHEKKQDERRKRQQWRYGLQHGGQRTEGILVALARANRGKVYIRSSARALVTASTN